MTNTLKQLEAQVTTSFRGGHMQNKQETVTLTNAGETGKKYKLLSREKMVLSL